MFAALALSLLASSVVALPQASQEIAPVTPASLVQCQPILFQWSGGKAPYYVSLIPGVGNPSAAAVVDFGKLDGTSQTWMVNQPVDTDLTLKIVDSDGKYQFSAPVKVQKGSSDECLKETGSGAAGASATAAGSDAPAASDAAPATDAEKETSVAPQGGAAETGTSAPAPAASTGAPAASAAAPSGSAAASGAKSADASHTSSASGTTASKAPAPATSSSGAGRIVASTGLIAAVVAAVALF